MSGVIAVSLSGLFEALYLMRWMFVFAAVLIAADLRFGVKAAKVRREKVRFSRAIRRTVGKAIDYVCWILVAAAFSQAFGVPFDMPLLPFIVLLIVYGCELNSCFANYFEAKGKRIRINIFRLFARKVDIVELKEDKGDAESEF